MIIGMDFDNTIVDYNGVFHRAAVERGWIPPKTPQSKNAVRDWLRTAGREEDWTALQGHVYGCRMLEADLYPGVMACLEACHGAGHTLFIISQKTRVPYRGPTCDLHQAAREFLNQKGFFDSVRTGLSDAHVFFELTKPGKIARIGQTACDVFLDDLPEILDDPAFPARTIPVLFDPSESITTNPACRRVSSWQAFQRMMNQDASHA